MDQSELYLMLGRMDGKLDTVLANQAAQSERSDDHEDRISKLERNQMFVVGAASAASIIISGLFALVAFLWDKIKWH